MVKRASGPGFSRSDRVAEQVRRELAQIFRSEIKDPQVTRLLSMVTVTEVEVSADYSHASVFFTALLDDAQTVQVSQSLARLSGFLRRELGRRIRIHQIPELHFKFDRSVSYGVKLSKLIDETIAADDLVRKSRDEPPIG